jgi:FixJ family two-component response regulator
MAASVSVRSMPQASPAPRAMILCVDDEPSVLSSLQLLLSRDYDVHTACGGPEGLEMLAKLGPVPVVVSDMRMPGMSGAEFLAEVAKRSPSSAGVLLTGVTDIEAAAAAINAGNLFRFLLKPCAAEELRSTLKAGVEQHRLKTAEKELLERTLMGSIRALTEMLAIADPVAFGRTARLKELAVMAASRLAIWDTWAVEYAALVCQIGNISLSTETARKLYGGETLTMQEKLQVEAATKLTPAVVKHIPRLEQVTKILEDLASERAQKGGNICDGAKILRAVLAYEALERTSRTRSIAINMFQSRRGEFDAASVNALLEVLGAPAQSTDDATEVEVSQLKPGMVINTDFRSVTGALLVPSGTEITAGLLAKLLNFPKQQLPQKIRIRPQG